jgi:uncharacterized protein YndB with AHSA1/START domain
MNLSSTLERTPSPMLRAASVRVTRQIGAPPERIFDAWLRADVAPRFLFADGIGEAISSRIDARVGGGFRIMRYRDGRDVEYSGEYLEIDRPHRLVFSLFVERYAQWDDRVIVELARVGEQSLLLLTHELSLQDARERARVRRGWERILERLGEMAGGARH